MKAKGLSLSEVMLVLALGAVIMIVAAHYYSQVRESEKITTLLGQINSIIDAAGKCVAGNAGNASSTQNNITTCLTLTTLISEDFLSTYYTTSPWGTITGVPANNNTAIQITANNVPNNACLAMESRLNAEGNQEVFVSCANNTITVTASY